MAQQDESPYETVPLVAAGKDITPGDLTLANDDGSILAAVRCRHHRQTEGALPDHRTAETVYRTPRYRRPHEDFKVMVGNDSRLATSGPRSDASSKCRVKKRTRKREAKTTSRAQDLQLRSSSVIPPFQCQWQEPSGFSDTTNTSLSTAELHQSVEHNYLFCTGQTNLGENPYFQPAE